MQEKAQRPAGLGWNVGDDIFFKQKNVFVFASLALGGGGGRQSRPHGEAQSHVCFGKVWQGRVSMKALGRISGQSDLGRLSGPGF